MSVTAANIDIKAYRDHVLRVHGQVARRGVDIPVPLGERELAVVRAGVLRRQKESRDRVTQRREELGILRVFDRETPRRLHDNEIRNARRHRAQEEARRGAITPPHPPSYGDVSQA